MFTIVTITYNAEKYLEETLRSVAEQDFKDIEHIVWDGGSTDRTLEIVSQFPHVQLRQGKDEGISDAMNQGAAHAHGKFLLFLHADDLLASTQSIQDLAIEIEKHPDSDWFYGRAHIIDHRGECLRTTPLEQYSFKRLRKYNFITHPSTITSRRLFNAVGGFDTRLKYCMDYDLWLKMAQYAKPTAVPAILSCFREHGQSTSISHPLAVTDEAYQIRNRYVCSLWERWRSYRTWKRRRCSIS